MRCIDCGYLFTEWDDMERRAVSWCTFNSIKTGYMRDMSEKGFRCPLTQNQNERKEQHGKSK